MQPRRLRVALMILTVAASGWAVASCDVALDPTGDEAGDETSETGDASLCADVSCADVEVGLCEVAACDELTGECAVSAVDDGDYCWAGDLCVIAQYCEAGVCIGGEDPLPDCGIDVCGTDPCGNVCGTCDAGLECSDGQCGPPCDEDCEGKACGDDGCGGSCGACLDTEVCGLESFTCVPICEPACGDAVCGDDGCGGSCGTCGGGSFCADGACELDCQPQCDGKACGDDGCGGECGECLPSEECTDAGQCHDQAPPCGDVTAAGCCDGNTLYFCQGIVLEILSCADSCGWDVDGSYYDCDDVGEDPSGANPISCAGG